MGRRFPKVTDMLSFRGRRALVTGAAGGIGLAAAKRLREVGARVMLLDLQKDALERAGAQLTGGATNGAGDETVTVHAVDLSRREQVDAFWNGLSEEELPDIVVNNAGIYPMRDFLEVDDDQWRHTMTVNLDSVFWMCQHFIRRRLSLPRQRGGVGRGRADRSGAVHANVYRGGVIVNVSSIEAILPFKEDMVPYTTSKAGVLTLTRGLARDYAKDGFRINVIVPGAIKTPGTDRLIRRALSRMQLRLWRTGYDFQQRLPLGRWGDPDEVARVVVFLASDMASYVQGAVIPIDGGFLST